MSIGRWMDKEAVVHIYNRVLLSYKNECIWVSSKEVDEFRAYYTEWSKSERETQISYINAYMWNLERWYLWSNTQDSKEDTGIKNRLLDTVGEGEGGMIWENSIEAYALPYVKQIASGSLTYDLLNPKLVLGDNLERGVEKEVRGAVRREGTHVCLWLIHVDV